MRRVFTLLFMSLSLLGYAQQFQLSNLKGEPYSDGETISITITEDDLNFMEEFFIEIKVENLTDTELNVKTLRTNTVLVDGMSAYVCFGNCFAPDVLAINCNILSNSEIYSLHLTPNGKFGLSTFKLEFWSKENASDKVTLFVNIDMQPLGIKEQTHQKVSLFAYPNPAPANSTIKISYTLATQNDNHHLKIRNILGTVVMDLPLNPFENSVAIDISNLVSGVYFYSMESNQQVSIAKKLIVK